jgi:C1A family cysteine protease
LKNYYSIQEHNEAYRNGSISYEQGVNEFTHLDQDEFIRSRTGYIPGSINATIWPSSGRVPRASATIWASNLLGPVTDQGPCGSCTIFAVIGVMEAHMRIHLGVNEKLSEQEAMQCCGGCDGGTNTNIYNYAVNGATREANLRYAAKVLEQCNTRRPRVRGSKVKSYYRIQKGRNAANDGVERILRNGPLVTGFCVPDSFVSYRGGVYSDENMSNCGWHAVMVVGFGEENGKDFWIIRNSWGEL